LSGQGYTSYLGQEALPNPHRGPHTSFLALEALSSSPQLVLRYLHLALPPFSLSIHQDLLTRSPLPGWFSFLSSSPSFSCWHTSHLSKVSLMPPPLGCTPSFPSAVVTALLHTSPPHAYRRRQDGSRTMRHEKQEPEIQR
jgi:hypothetical protein